MMTTARRLSAIAAAVAALIALSACGDSGDEPAPSSAATSSATPSPTPSYNAAVAFPAEKWDEYQRLLSEQNLGEDPSGLTKEEAPSVAVNLCNNTDSDMAEYVSMSGDLYTGDELESANQASLLFVQAYCPQQKDSLETAIDDPQPQYAVPVKSDFSLAVKTLRKKCFGRAGCNIDYRIELTSNTLEDFDPDITYDVTYKVTGGDDTSINTLEVTGDSYSYDQEESLSTLSSSAKLRAVVTDVEEQVEPGSSAVTAGDPTSFVHRCPQPAWPEPGGADADRCCSVRRWATS